MPRRRCAPDLNEASLRAQLTSGVESHCTRLERAVAPLELSPAARADAVEQLLQAALEPWWPTLATIAAAQRLARLTAAATTLDDRWIVSGAHIERIRRLSALRLERAAANQVRALASIAASRTRLPGGTRRPSRILRLDTPGAETHNGGRSPLRVTLDCSVDVIFKPVCIANEQLFRAVVEALGDRLAPVQLLCPKSVSIAADAGFVQWLAGSGSALLEPALCRFHRRLGALIALAYALNATDLHLDNVLAIGEHPVLIDLEMLLYRFPNALGESDVTFSGLVEPPSSAVPLSGSQGGGDLPTLGMWHGAGAVHYRQPMRHVGNRPLDRHGSPVAVSAYVDDVLEGFSYGYEVAASRRTSILRLVERFVAARAPRTRHLLRFTAYYALHLLGIVQPQETDAAVMVRRRLMSDESAADTLTEALVDCEVADLVSGDVPYFFAHPDALALEHHSGLRVGGFFECTALDALRNTLERLGREDQRAQERLLRRALLPHQVL